MERGSPSWLLLSAGPAEESFEVCAKDCHLLLHHHFPWPAYVCTGRLDFTDLQTALNTRRTLLP